MASKEPFTKTSEEIKPESLSSFEGIKLESLSTSEMSQALSLSAEKTDSESDNQPKILPFQLGYLTPEMEEEARLVLHETDEAKQSCLTELRELIETLENLVCRTDDNFLRQFLRARKYNVEKAFKLFKKYFEFRKDYDHIYRTINVENVKQVILHNILGYLPMRDRNGSVVVVLKIGSWNPDVDLFNEVFRSITAGLTHAIEDPATQVAGFRVIIDCRGLYWKHAQYATPQNALLIIRSTQIMHHGANVNALHEYIHPSILPEEYGGTQGSFEMHSWLDIMDKEADFLVGMSKYGYR